MAVLVLRRSLLGLRCLVGVLRVVLASEYYALLLRAPCWVKERGLTLINPCDVVIHPTREDKMNLPNAQFSGLVSATIRLGRLVTTSPQLVSSIFDLPTLPMLILVRLCRCWMAKYYL